MRQLNLLIGDPVSTGRPRHSESPDFVMAQRCAPGCTCRHRTRGHRRRTCLARRRAEAARDGRERGHLVDPAPRRRTWRAASQVLEDVTIDYPLTSWAAGRPSDHFFRGGTRVCCATVSRAHAPPGRPARPAIHAVLGMQASRPAENGDMPNEKNAAAAVEAQPRMLAQHARRDVMEMQGRIRGHPWMVGTATVGAGKLLPPSHQLVACPLYHLDLGEIDEVLALFDGRSTARASRVILEMIDARRLWRLNLRGVAVSKRGKVAMPGSRWAGGPLCFRRAMPRLRCGRRPHGLIARVLDAQTRAMRGDGDNAQFPARSAIGHARPQGVRRWPLWRGVRLLREVRNIATARRSHAQRDVLDLTLIERRCAPARPRWHGRSGRA